MSKPTIVMIDAANGTRLLRTDPIREATYTYWPYLLGEDRDDTHNFGEDRIDFQYYFSGRADSPKAMEPEELPQAARQELEFVFLEDVEQAVRAAIVQEDAVLP